MKFEWVRFDPAGELPPERRDVLVKLDCSPDNKVGAVAVGYVRRWSGGPFFVVPAVKGPWVVTHWCDCLGDDWGAPGWYTRQAGKMRFPIDVTEVAGGGGGAVREAGAGEHAVGHRGG